MMLVMYLSSMVRSIIALHNLIDNKEARAKKEREAARQQQRAHHAVATDKQDGDKQANGDAETPASG